MDISKLELRWAESVTAGGYPVWHAYVHVDDEDDWTYRLLIRQVPHGAPQSTWCDGEIINRYGRIMESGQYRTRVTAMLGLVRRLAKY